MEYRQLGHSDLRVSAIGLGTMTFGEQTSEADAHAQLDRALAQGVNLIDTAEMYPAPPRAETQGRTEAYIGSWLARTGRRREVILATKAVGPPDGPRGLEYLRGGRTRLDASNLRQALEASLRRLRTDYVDLYQVHWPDRTANRFGQIGYRHVDDERAVPIEETLAALSGLVRAGKARYIGVSNETPWGVAQYLQAAAGGALERIVSIQNPYNLLNRSFEVGLAEFAIRERVGLLAYSPLAFGMLTGKYRDGARPPAARVVRWPRYGRYSGEAAQRALAEYLALARQHGLDPAQMAIAFVMAQRWVSSVLLGASTLAQLEQDLAAGTARLSPELLEALEQIQRRHPNPAG
ncbi:MAG: NADP(H)-dependent aldo-keto reductase [Gammaproteobacteria bacterium]|nr:NADP(H)-dependent aldo-keto reductase [Gammaproteobacteria bacterium]